MPNFQKPGFRPARAKGAGTISYARRRVLSNNTNAISLYDALVTSGGGDVVRATATSTAVGTVNGNGVSYVDANGSRIGAKALPAATVYSGTAVDNENASFVFVPDNAVNIEFECSVDGAIGLTDLDLNYAMVLGTPTNGYSGHELAATGRAVTATLPWRVVGFVHGPSNDTAAADAAVFAMINAGQLEPALTTTGT